MYPIPVPTRFRPALPTRPERHPFMTDPHRDPNPDSPPREDDRGSIEQIDEPRDPRQPEPTIDDAVPDAGNGAVGGTDGMVKNQDE